MHSKFCTEKHRKSAKIMDVGLPKPSQNPFKIQLKSMSQKPCDVSSIFPERMLCRKSAAIDFVLVFPIQNGFRAVSALHARVQQKTSKNNVLEPPKPSSDFPGTLQIQARSVPRHTKPSPNDNKRSKTGKRRPRTAQEPKKKPTWRPRPSQILRNFDPLAWLLPP